MEAFLVFCLGVLMLSIAALASAAAYMIWKDNY